MAGTYRYTDIPADRTALILPDKDRRVTYGELWAQVEVVARALAGAGVTAGDRVAIALPNGLGAVVSFLAASLAGTAAPLSPAYKEPEFRFFFDDTAPKVLLLPPVGADEARRAADDRIPIITIDDRSGAVVPPGGPLGRCPADAPGHAVALVLHTSGSTGRPKRVPLTHGDLAISIRNIAQTYALGEDDVSLCAMPLFHVHGLVASTLTTLATGGTVLLPPAFQPLGFWRIARQYGATWYSASPSLHQLLLTRHDARRSQVARLRFIRSCSAPLSPQLMHALEDAFETPVVEAYGMTEAAHQVTSNPLPPGRRVPGSVGPPGAVDVGIVDEDGRPLAAGVHGEVVLRGPNVIRAYEENPEANAASFVNGWFRTGDQGYLGDDGYLRLVGRIKELINRGGEKIAPREIDEVLLAHPAIAEAVSFGVPHPTWGEEVAAVVVPREPVSEATLISFCEARLADFKCPIRVHVAEEIPRTQNGKIMRRVVAAAYASGARTPPAASS